MAKLFLDMERQVAEPDIVIYNASSRVPGSALERRSRRGREIDRHHHVSARFWPPSRPPSEWSRKGRGAIFFTGASAGMKGFAQSAAFAMGKFGLRGLAQSAARELGPKGDPRRPLQHRRRRPLTAPTGPERSSLTARSILDADLAGRAVDVLAQPRNAWSHEIPTFRPWTERF